MMALYSVDLTGWYNIWAVKSCSLSKLLFALYMAVVSRWMALKHINLGNLDNS
jgi:hypothetical protein